MNITPTSGLHFNSSVQDTGETTNANRPKPKGVLFTINNLPAIIAETPVYFCKSENKAEHAKMEDYYVITTEDKNKKRNADGIERNIFKGKEFLRDAKDFINPTNPQVFHKSVDGYIGADGYVYSPTLSVHEKENLYSSIKELAQDNNVNSVVALPVSTSGNGNRLLNVHRHQEKEEDWGFEQDFIATPGGLVTGDRCDPQNILNTLYQELNEETGFTDPKELNINGMMFDPRTKVMYFSVSTPEPLPEIDGTRLNQKRYAPFVAMLKANETYSDPDVQHAAGQGKIICAARLEGKFDLTMSRNLPLNLNDPALPLVRPDTQEGRGITAGLAADKMHGRFGMFINSDVRDFLVNTL
ncbi:hypothetical protein BIY29_17755 [Brenneria alni]|uniref:Nudix hydrolase domain-containing protein n=1 Tax=Brenneria alni TaxID=71656 RepID=A0A421DJI4_9GAMM|nr:hypothetical protein [Brenneria alni]RLM18755.1 hypothetical protein BIY29_17755 [Brenneria alni]